MELAFSLHPFVAIYRVLQYNMIGKIGGYSKCYAILNIIINLFVLCIYKYYNFFADSLIEAFSSLGIELNLNSFNIVLVGNCFYTFQVLSLRLMYIARK